MDITAQGPALEMDIIAWRWTSLTGDGHHCPGTSPGDGLQVKEWRDPVALHEQQDLERLLGMFYGAQT